MSFVGMGWQEILVIAVVAIMIFGPDKMPEMAGQAGKLLRDFRRLTQDMSGEFEKQTGVSVKDLKANVDKEIAGLKSEMAGTTASVQKEINSVKSSVNKTATSVGKSVSSATGSKSTGASKSTTKSSSTAKSATTAKSAGSTAGKSTKTTEAPVVEERSARRRFVYGRAGTRSGQWEEAGRFERSGCSRAIGHWNAGRRADAGEDPPAECRIPSGPVESQLSSDPSRQFRSASRQYALAGHPGRSLNRGRRVACAFALLISPDDRRCSFTGRRLIGLLLASRHLSGREGGAVSNVAEGEVETHEASPCGGGSERWRGLDFDLIGRRAAPVQAGDRSYMRPGPSWFLEAAL